MTGFVTALREGVLMCDGAMGTMLHAAGNSLDRALPELNLSNAELVSTVHESYLSAGVDVIQTNTFGASALRLAEHGSAGPPPRPRASSRPGHRTRSSPCATPRWLWCCRSRTTTAPRLARCGSPRASPPHEQRYWRG